MNTFVTAIGTDSGKTLVSAILCEAWGAGYWKPVQAGTEECDRDAVKRLVRNPSCVFYDEQYVLTQPMSPHAAAKADGVTIDLAAFQVPDHDGTLVIEGAGGLLVPLNDRDMVADLIPQLDAELVLVCNLYLGSINHSLLTINEIRRRGLRVKGLVFNGPPNPESERIIAQHAGWECLLKIGREATVTPETIQHYARKLVG